MYPDASAVAQAFAPARLTMARELAGMRKIDLAQAIERTAAAVSQYELGQARPSAETLQRCAVALDVPVSFFTAGRPQLRLDTAGAHFRSLRSTTAHQRQQALAHVELLWELIDQLDNVLELPRLDLGLPLGARPGGPAAVAAMIRTAWEVPPGPVAHLVRTLETRGLVLTQLPGVDAETIDAFSAALGGRPIIVLSRKGNPMRQRFSVAHELGHLLLHPEPAPGDSRHEREANVFAAELLMPGDEIIDRLPSPVDITDLKEIADGYGVSVAALAYRGKDLGVYSESTLKRIMATLTRLGWRTEEPVSSRYPGERPELLTRAAELAERHGLPLPVLAERLHLPLPRLRELLGMPDPKPRLRLIHGDG